jgi:hypothetical protein
MSQRDDITGRKFNFLTAIRFNKAKKGQTYWFFKCDCGQEKSYLRPSVKFGRTISCGCMHGKKKFIPRIHRLCDCGCGDGFQCRPKSKRRFVNFHQNIGSHHSEETKAKLSFSKIGNKNPMKRLGVRLKVGNSLKEKHSWNKGKKLSDSHRSNLSMSHIGYQMPDEQKRKIGDSHLGEKHWNWQGGKSFEPYPLGWTTTFKEQIRYRDGYRCQICGIPEVETGRKCDVHHKDYVKNNIDPNNLICLCRQCHHKTNYKRESWLDYFCITFYPALLRCSHHSYPQISFDLPNKKARKEVLLSSCGHNLEA